MKEIQPLQEFDVIIIGGGITGSIASILLNNKGYRIGIIEKSSLSDFKPGESLDPKCKVFFQNLNIGLTSTNTTEYFGYSSLWASKSIDHNDFIFNPYGNGISIDRVLFEKSLISQSKLNGILCYLEVSINEICFNGEFWNIQINKNEAFQKIKAKFLIVATGRKMPFKFFLSKKTFFDRLICLSGISSTEIKVGSQNTLYIESLQEGWYYTNILPGKKRVMSIFTDNDLLIKEHADYYKKQILSTIWYNSIDSACLNKVENVFVCDARTSWSNIQSGKGWLLLGDTAYTIDPLSGQGIYKNLQMIQFCVDNFESFLHCHEEALKDYVSFNKKNFERYWLARSDAYQMGNRWHSKFWERRMP
ncbi:NAD(P)/FAD-dependent oxidoreductase [Parafilimonas sp.]|uniref:NAD(P)/FAD-dependent oxidoreductase n=1 Tax=Parafilimonas sp. TaxID=1969739 RepID=UPI0039E3867A